MFSLEFIIIRFRAVNFGFGLMTYIDIPLYEIHICWKIPTRWRHWNVIHVYDLYESQGWKHNFNFSLLQSLGLLSGQFRIFTASCPIRPICWKELTGLKRKYYSENNINPVLKNKNNWLETIRPLIICEPCKCLIHSYIRYIYKTWKIRVQCKT